MLEERIRYHEHRAEYWLSQGRPDYAEGSMLKAQRWRQRLRELDVAFYGEFPMTPVEALFYEQYEKIGQQILDTLEKVMLGESS